MIQRKLDRVIQFDQRSRAFRAVEGIENKNFRSYTWPCKTVLDQGSEGACVGFSFAHELAAVPVAVPNVTNDYAREIYHVARTLDEWDGENYEGTSVLAGIKAVQKISPFLGDYRWAFGIEDLVRVIGHKGPCVLGINWYTGMFDPDQNGYLHKAGYVAGGHAILARGVRVNYLVKTGPKNEFSNVDLDSSYIVLHNSWGPSWGYNGTARISLREMSELLQEQGEAVIPTIRNK